MTPRGNRPRSSSNSLGVLPPRTPRWRNAMVFEPLARPAGVMQRSIDARSDLWLLGQLPLQLFEFLLFHRRPIVRLREVGKRQRDADRLPAAIDCLQDQPTAL